jgi:hypothetical protein
MELCSIQDAFPDIQGKNPAPGCTDVKSSKEERRAARKRAKKCKGSPEEYLNMVDNLPETDPDRPAVKRMGDLPAFASYSDAFKDLSGGTFEAFKMPTLPSSNCLTSDPGYPSYFGKGLEDVAEEAPPVNWPSSDLAKQQLSSIVKDGDALKGLVRSSKGIGSGKSDVFAAVGSTTGTAGLALYNSGTDHTPRGGMVAEDEGFQNMFNDSADTVLNETFEYEFGGKGIEKAGAVKTLPAPSLNDAWKPLTTAKTSTAFFTAKKPPKSVEPSEELDLRDDKKRGEIVKNDEPLYKPGSEPATTDDDPETMRNQMAQQLRELMKKFEDLEAKRQRDTKNEVLLFVGTGLFVLVSLDIVSRLSRR